VIDASIIIPVKNEEDNILPLAQEVSEAFSGKPYQWECIWIDDGSTDRTRQRLEDLRRMDGRHRYLAFAKNAGQSTALWAGFGVARGPVICTIDGDGQNDPADLPHFIALLQHSKADMIAGYRAVRRDKWVRKFSSKIGNRFRTFVTGFSVRDTGCSTKVMRKSALISLPPFRGMHRFLPTLFVIMGYRVEEAAANHRPRLTASGIDWDRDLWIVSAFTG
jgi:glycosyltransferase involved in cell wall biosynthesis